MKMKQVDDGRNGWVEGMELGGGCGPWGTVMKMDCGRSGRVELPVAGVGRRKRSKNRKTSGRVGRSCSICGQAASRPALHAKKRENNSLLLYFAVRSDVFVSFRRRPSPGSRSGSTTARRVRASGFGIGKTKGTTTTSSFASWRPSARRPDCMEKKKKEASRYGVAPRHDTEGHWEGPSKLRTPASFQPRRDTRSKSWSAKVTCHLRSRPREKILVDWTPSFRHRRPAMLVYSRRGASTDDRAEVCLDDGSAVTSAVLPPLISRDGWGLSRTSARDAEWRPAHREREESGFVGGEAPFFSVYFCM